MTQRVIPVYLADKSDKSIRRKPGKARVFMLVRNPNFTSEPITERDSYSNYRSLVTMALALSLLFSANAFAGTNSFSRTAVSGQPKQIAAYHSWDPQTCKSLSAKMTVLSKPSHGVLIPHVVPRTITLSRFGSVGRCAGTPIKALQVDYKSARGYRGTDTFTIEVIFGFEGRQDTDNYTVTIE